MASDWIYDIRVNYVIDEGLDFIPGEDGPMYVRTTAASAVKTVQFHCYTTGGKPILPDWNPANSGEVLLSRVISPVSPYVNPANRQDGFQASGSYTYGLSEIPTEFEIPLPGPAANGNVRIIYRDTDFVKSFKGK